MTPKHILIALAETSPLGYDPDQEEIYCIYCWVGEPYTHTVPLTTALSMSRLSNPYAHPADCPWRMLVDTMEVDE